MLELMYATGLRVSELINLTYQITYEIGVTSSIVAKANNTTIKNVINNTIFNLFVILKKKKEFQHTDKVIWWALNTQMKRFMLRIGMK